MVRARRSKLSAQQSRSTAAVAIDNDDIGGVVTGANGPEAGVWVIAETTDLPTRYAKMVVTDDQGRYVVPDLPKAKYKVWVRGYGLVDSAKVDGEPGKQLNLTRGGGAERRRGGEILSGDLLVFDAEDPGRRPVRRKDGDIPEKVKQSDWLNLMKNNGCVGCHQMGQLSTRTFPPGLGEFASHSEAWVQAHAGRAVRRADGEHPGRPARRLADQVFRRLDRARRQGRAAEDQAAAAARASSATSWSPPGTGATRRSICTT